MKKHKPNNSSKATIVNQITLSDMQKDELLIFCWCNNCGHNVTISPDILIEKLGYSYPVPSVSLHMRCSVCNTRDVTTRPNWPTHGGQITHHS